MTLATPETFVAVAATPWSGDVALMLQQVYEETWIESATVKFADERHGTLESGGFHAELIFEEAIPELTGLAGTSMEPFGPSELVLLKNHISTLRVVVKSGEHPRASASFLVKVLSTLIEAGANAVLIPMAIRLHSPRAVRLLSVDPDDVQAMTTLLVHAWDQDGWMRTRGLTAFGLPELDTPISSGINDAFFRLMDVAANMVERECKFMAGSELMMGPRLLTVTSGPNSGDDSEVPIAGHFGVQSLIPAA